MRTQSVFPERGSEGVLMKGWGPSWVLTRREGREDNRGEGSTEAGGPEGVLEKSTDPVWLVGCCLQVVGLGLLLWVKSMQGMGDP